MTTHLTPEHRAKIAESVRRHYADPVARKRNSEARKGKPSRGGHVTMHVQRGVINPNCVFCQQEQGQDGGSDA